MTLILYKINILVTIKGLNYNPTTSIIQRGSSLFYNTSARHRRHECDTNDTSATWVRHERHEWNTSETRFSRMRCKCHTHATRMTRLRHECYTNETSATRVRNFDFDNDMSEIIFLHPYISYMANGRLQWEEQFQSENHLLKMPRFHAKMHLKSAPQKLNFVMVKAISKTYTLDFSCKCSCTFPLSYA